MKFIVSKKIIENRALYVSVLWMVIFLLVAMVLNAITKGLDFGITPAMWVTAIAGNEAEFIEPLAMKDILLTLHTELFGLILIFIFISALTMRTSRPKELKMAILVTAITALLLYPIGVLSSLAGGSFFILVAWGGFLTFHLVMIGSGIDILNLLLRKRL